MYLGFMYYHPVAQALSNEFGQHLQMFWVMGIAAYFSGMAPKVDEWLLVIKHS